MASQSMGVVPQAVRRPRFKHSLRRPFSEEPFYVINGREEVLAFVGHAMRKNGSPYNSLNGQHYALAAAALGTGFDLRMPTPGEALQVYEFGGVGVETAWTSVGIRFPADGKADFVEYFRLVPGETLVGTDSLAVGNKAELEALRKARYLSTMPTLAQMVGEEPQLEKGTRLLVDGLTDASWMGLSSAAKQKDEYGLAWHVAAVKVGPGHLRGGSPLQRTPVVSIFCKDVADSENGPADPSLFDIDLIATGVKHERPAETLPSWTPVVEASVLRLDDGEGVEPRQIAEDTGLDVSVVEATLQGLDRVGRAYRSRGPESRRFRLP